VVYPGVVLRSHGRERLIHAPLRQAVFPYDGRSGRIEEKALSR
jgi:hypothetical protein